jgi:hypothetical protein
MTGGRWRGDDVVEGAGAKTAFYRVFASNENHSVCNERHWIPAFAGMTIFRLIASQMS